MVVVLLAAADGADAPVEVVVAAAAAGFAALVSILPAGCY